MKISLPKEMRGYTFYPLTSLELNDFDVERLLPSLFFLVVTRGRGRGRIVNDANGFEKYLAALTSHAGLSGFDDPAGRRVLARWLRSSVLSISRAGRGHSREQIDYAQPLTLLTYKTGLPTEVRRHRNAHLFIYRRLVEAQSQGSGASAALAAANLGELFAKAFGRGLTLTPGPDYQGAYDGRTELDLQTLLSVYCLDGFDPTPVASKERGEEYPPALPALAERLGYHLLAYLQAYREQLPVAGLAGGLMTLINLELLRYTRQMMVATNHLMVTGSDALLRAAEPTEAAYVDFVRDRGHPSDALARASVERDLEELGRFYESLMTLRTLDRLVQRSTRRREAASGLETPAYLAHLRGLRDSAEIEEAAAADLDSIKYAAREVAGSDADRAEVDDWLEAQLADPARTSLGMLVGVLTEVQRQQAANHIGQWFWSVGGLRKSHGLLQGNLSGRRNWRYAMSDDLLRTLVQLALVEDPNDTLQHVCLRPRLKLAEFLTFLETRFGLLVARPPDFLDSPSARAAAADNLAALKRRLRQMGYFEALSDDFNAQYLRAPQATPVESPLEVV